jgi:hypothetical protein
MLHLSILLVAPKLAVPLVVASGGNRSQNSNNMTDPAASIIIVRQSHPASRSASPTVCFMNFSRAHLKVDREPEVLLVLCQHRLLMPSCGQEISARLDSTNAINSTIKGVVILYRRSRKTNGCAVICDSIVRFGQLKVNNCQCSIRDN